MNKKSNTELTLKEKTRNWLTGEKLRAQIAENLPRHVTPDRFMRIALTATQRNPLLLEATQASLFQAMMDLSARGLEPDGYHAHLIPFRNNRAEPPTVECQLIVDYKGLIAQMRRSGDVIDVNAEVVYENDKFDIFLGTERRIEHFPALMGDRGEPVLVYTVVKLKDGTISFDWMSFEEIEEIRARSKSGNNGPWKTDWKEMAKKTVIKRHAKLLPLSDAARDIINLDNSAENPPLSLSERFDRAKQVDDVDSGMFDTPASDEAAQSDVQETEEEPESNGPEEAPEEKAAEEPEEPEEELEVRKLTPFESLDLNIEEEEGIYLEDVSLYAGSRKMSLDNEQDVKRLLAAWKTVAETIRQNKEANKGKKKKEVF